ncbi:serine/arginine repetitive matrix protein 1-like [Ananas comosus]|uniref:Serine/arginine repetitive matrix protein 1-like n=1 Tax=Ananas comosus TaxID=4615 RepID=A0A6P5ESE1_ANACO|nr:serine/arginine repetitive matrix protein 1-like [Ananas comosus]
MESSASSTTQNAEDLELEQVRSDLHALKILYGLLRKRENDSENTLRETEDWLDEKSRAFLVKLLDEATRRALRRQAKMLSCAVLSPSILDLAQRRRLDQASDSAVEEVAVLDYHRKCHQSEHASSTAEASPGGNPGPSREGLRLLKRLESRRSVLSQDGSKHGHERPIRRDLDRAGIDRSSETRKNADHVITPVDELTRQQHLRPIAKPPCRSPTKHAAVAAGYNSGEPAHKRSRLESEDERPGRTPSRVRTDRRTERELTRVKSNRFPKEPRVKERAERAHGPELNVAVHVLRRSGSLKGGRLEEPGSPDRRAQISQPKKRADQGKVEGKEIVKLSSRRSRIAAPEKPPSREEARVDRVKTSRELGRRRSRLVERENGGTTDRVGPSRTNRPPINPSKTRSSKARYSSSSGSTTRSSDSGSSPGTTSATESHSSTRSARERTASASASARNGKHRGEVPRRAVGPSVPRRHQAGPSQAAPTGHHASEERRPRRRRPPAAAKADRLQMKPADQREGRLRRLRNKLAIVFHHQHRHHHFHHHHHHPGHADGDSSSQEEGEEDDDDGAHRRENHHKRSPWGYLRRILHRASDEEDRGERAAEKVVPAHHQHGHVRALFEALLTHVWGTRRRRRKPVRANRPGVGRSASRLRLRKLHWWQRLRRRGGVKLGDSKKPPLRLGRK